MTQLLAVAERLPTMEGRAILSRSDYAERIAINTPLARGQVELIRSSRDLLIQINDIVLKPPFRTTIPVSDRLYLRFPVSGIMNVAMSDGKPIQIDQHIVLHDFTQKGEMSCWAHEQEYHYRSIVVEISRSYFAALMQDCGRTDMIQVEKSGFCISAPLEAFPASMRMAMSQMLTCNMSGRLRANTLSALAEQIVCTFLAQLTESTAGEPGSASLTSKQVQRLAIVRQRIIDNPSQVPVLEILARDVGTNRCDLASGFRQLYGTSVQAFAREMRLELAHRLLTDTDRSILDVSLAVGFAFPGNFSPAFKARYGISPSDLRRTVAGKHCNNIARHLIWSQATVQE